MIKSMILDHCWICDTKFIPNGPAHEERHHIIPRAYGGSDGPMVSLCDTCHTRVHKVALALQSNSMTNTLTIGLDQKQQQKLYYLATCVLNAKLATMNDPNKKAVVVLPLSGKETEDIDRLKKVLGVPSRTAVVKAAVSSLFNKYFVKDL